MTSSDLHVALLRPAVLQVLRAAGFNYARPAVIETATDLAARYLLLLASSTAQNAFNNHNEFVPTVQDVRLALVEAGALVPQMSTSEELARGEVEVGGAMVPFEDLRGVRAFVSWAQGPVNKEIRRVAGLGKGDEADIEAAAQGFDEQEDYLTAIKKKNNKTSEDSRYQGTVLGKDSELQSVPIVGGPADSIAAWGVQSRLRSRSPQARRAEALIEAEMEAEAEASATPATSGISSAPATPFDPDAMTPASE